MLFEGLAATTGIELAKFVGKQVLDLSTDALKDYVKDFFKGTVQDGVMRLHPDVLKVAMAAAVKAFIELFEAELDYCDVEPTTLQHFYKPTLKKFVKDAAVKPVLGSAFQRDCKLIDAAAIQAAWVSYQPKGTPFPAEFDWSGIAKQYAREVKAIVKADAELGRVLSLELDEERNELLKRSASLPVDFDLRKYREALREEYGNLKLDSLDTSGYAYDGLKLWRMFIAQEVRECQQFIPQLYELPKEAQERLKKEGLLDEGELERLVQQEPRRQEYFSQAPRSVLEVCKEEREPYVVILGDPGSGKSTLLQYLALEWAEQEPGNEGNQKIPVLIELRQFVRNRERGLCRNFMEFIHSSSGRACHLNQHDLSRWFKEGRALVMFDGLDEIFDRGIRDDVVADIHRFSNDYPQVQIVVTSRVIGYKAQALRDAGFRHFMLQDLEVEQIEDFIQRWHEQTFGPKEERDKEIKRERLLKAIRESRSIRQLAGNPLLLTMMAILNRNQELPRDRAELYNQASRVLLHQWDVERALREDDRVDPKTIDYRDKQAMLRQVAYAMQASENGLKGNMIHQRELEDILAGYLVGIVGEQARVVARVMAQQLRTRNFILCDLGDGYFGFVHRTFLEYFCASEFVYRFKEKPSPELELTFEELQQQTFESHWQDETWHEVLRLIAGMIEPRFVGEVIEYLIGEDAIDESMIQRSEFSLGGASFEMKRPQLQKKGLVYLLLAADLLREVRNRGSIEQVSQTLFNSMQILADREYPYLLESEAAEALFFSIANTWSEKSGLYDWLQISLKPKIESQVPVAAIKTIGQAGVKYVDSLTLLKDRATSDDNWAVRQAVVQELARGWKDDPDTLTILKDRALNDDDKDVREKACQLISEGWRDDMVNMLFLVSRLLDDPELQPEELKGKSSTEILDIIWEDTVEEEVQDEEKELLMLMSQKIEEASVRDWAKEKLTQLD